MIQQIIDRIKFWIQLRSWERQKRKEGFPKEWFYNNPIDEDYIPLEDYSIDNVDMDIELELGKEQLGEEE